MIFASCVIYYKEDGLNELQDMAEKLKNVEICHIGDITGKLVVVIESPTEEGIEKTVKKLQSNDAVISAEYHAFHFGEEVN